MAERWRCRNCDIVYDGKPDVCPDCADVDFEPVGDWTDDITWECVECGLTYPEYPSVCTDCAGKVFERSEGADDLERTFAVPDTESDDGDGGVSHSWFATFRRNWGTALGILAVVAIAAAFAIGVIGPGLLADNPCSDVDSSAGSELSTDRLYVECNVHEEVDDERQQRDMSALRFSDTRHQVARDMAEEMGQNELSPDEASAYFDLGTRLQSCTTDGVENYAIYQTLPVGSQTNAELVDDIVNNLNSDAPTREAAYSRGYENHAVGVSVSGTQAYVVHLFC